MAIKHAFTSGISDGGDATLVRPSDWNADHADLGKFTSLTGFTSFGSPTTVDRTTFPDFLYVAKSSSGGNNLDGTYVAASQPFTFTAKLRDCLLGTNYQSGGIVIAEATPGKLHSWGIVTDTEQRYLQRYAWTSPTSAGANTNYPNLATSRLRVPAFLRIVAHSDSDVDFYYSAEGFLWAQAAAAVNPGFTIGAVGFFVNAFASVPVQAVFEWYTLT